MTLELEVDKLGVMRGSRDGGAYSLRDILASSSALAWRLPAPALRLAELPPPVPDSRVQLSPLSKRAPDADGDGGGAVDSAGWRAVESAARVPSRERSAGGGGAQRAYAHREPVPRDTPDVSMFAMFAMCRDTTTRVTQSALGASSATWRAAARIVEADGASAVGGDGLGGGAAQGSETAAHAAPVRLRPRSSGPRLPVVSPQRAHGSGVTASLSASTAAAGRVYSQLPVLPRVEPAVLAYVVNCLAPSVAGPLGQRRDALLSWHPLPRHVSFDALCSVLSTGVVPCLLALACVGSHVFSLEDVVVTSTDAPGCDAGAEHMAQLRNLRQFFAAASCCAVSESAIEVRMHCAACVRL